MSATRLFIEADLSAGVDTELSEGQAHYLRHVMRRGEGAPLLLFNGRDGEWTAALSLRGKKAAAAQTERLSVPEVRAPVELAGLLSDWPAGRRLLMCDETGGGPPIAAALAGLDEAARTAPWGIVIGPEGGFAERELIALRHMKD